MLYQTAEASLDIGWDVIFPLILLGVLFLIFSIVRGGLL